MTKHYFIGRDCWSCLDTESELCSPHAACIESSHVSRHFWIKSLTNLSVLISSFTSSPGWSDLLVESLSSHSSTEYDEAQFWAKLFCECVTVAVAHACSGRRFRLDRQCQWMVEVGTFAFSAVKGQLLFQQLESLWFQRPHDWLPILLRHQEYRAERRLVGRQAQKCRTKMFGKLLVSSLVDQTNSNTNSEMWVKDDKRRRIDAARHWIVTRVHIRS